MNKMQLVHKSHIRDKILQCSHVPADLPLIAHNDLNIIREFFINLPTNTELLGHFEKRFTDFLSCYLPELSQSLEHPNFMFWYYNEEYGIPAALPLPKNQVQPRQQSLKGQQALLLFLYQQLTYYGFLNKSRSIDEQILYCVGFADPYILEKKMKAEGCLFVEAGAQKALAHGKYSHLIQLVLLGLANERDHIRLQTPPRNLIALLLNFYKTTEYPYKQEKGWSLCLDLLYKNVMVGPMAINILFLSPIAELYCPTFFKHYGISYIKHLYRHHAALEGEPISDIIQFNISKIDLLEPSQADMSEQYERQHATIKVADNIYFKTEPEDPEDRPTRSYEFYEIEGYIGTAHHLNEEPPKPQKPFWA